MLMIDYFSWLAMCFTMSQFYLLSKLRYTAGWSMGVVSALAWGFFAVVSGLWAVLGLQMFLGVLCLRTLEKKVWLEESSGLSGRDVANSKNQKEKTASRNSNRGDGHDPIIGEENDWL